MCTRIYIAIEKSQVKNTSHIFKLPTCMAVSGRYPNFTATVARVGWNDLAKYPWLPSVVLQWLLIHSILWQWYYAGLPGMGV